MKSSKYLLILVLLGLIGLAYAQHPDTAWVRTYNGPDNYDDYANAISVDGDGNVYVTGASATISDWPYNYNFATIKYNPDGTIAWTSRYNGPGIGSDEAKAIALRSDTVYVTGHGYSDATFDDYTTIKYLPNGDTAWVRTYNGPGNDEDCATAIAVDGSGNVYVTGRSTGSGISPDYATIKYLPNGDTAWVRMYDGPQHRGDQANAIAVDGSGNVYVTGQSNNGPDEYTYDMDYATIKYNSDGDTVSGGWVRRYNGPANEDDYGNAIGVDGSGNVYVTGNSGDGYGNYTQDFATIKYNSTGDTAVANGGWVRRYTGPEDENDGAFALALRSDTVYVTGQSYRPSVSNDDYATIKYLPNGDTAWVRTYNGPTNNSDYAYAIAVDGTGDVYVTGRSFGSYDPWTGDNYATVKYNSAGVQQWDAIYNGPANGDDQASAIAVDGSGKAGNVYVTGASATNQYWPPCPDYATIKYSTTNAHWTITATAGNHGSIDPSGDVEVQPSADQSFTITPDFGYQVADVLVDGVSVGAETTYTFEDVTADHTIHAIFVWIITATTSDHGSIDPSGDVEVQPGADQSFTITPDDGFHVADVLVDGVSVGAVTTYTFEDVTADHTIHAAFAGWYQRLSMPGDSVNNKYVKAGGAMVFASDPGNWTDALYAFRGNKSREFYRWENSSWAAMCTIPDGYKPPRTDSGKINKKKYPGKGAALCWNGMFFGSTIYATKGGSTFEFWAYDVSSNTWTQKAFVPSTQKLKGGTSMAYYGGKVYLLAGAQKKDNHNNFFVYDTISNVWDTLTGAPLTPPATGKAKPFKDGSAISIIGNTIYAIKGGDKFNFFYAYDIAGDTLLGTPWTEIESIPRVHPQLGKKNKVGDGGAMTTDGSILYVIKGKGKQDFWSYSPISKGVWTPLDTIPRIDKKSVPKTGAALAYAWGELYLLKGNNTAEFWTYYIPSSFDFVARPFTPSTITSVMTEKTMTTSEFNFAVAPNPFTKLATIRYTVPISGKVTLKLYNVTGRLVETMNDGYLNAGTYTMNLTTRNISSGVYFLRYTDNTNKSEIKLVVQ
jgi:hypothetical protein